MSHVSVSRLHLFMFRFWTYLIVLYFQICYSWLISLIQSQGKKKDSYTIMSYNAIALQNLFLLNNRDILGSAVL